MENLLIDIYLFVCCVYDTSSQTCYQRMSNNREPEFTDQELITIWIFAHCEGCFEKKRMHALILKYWRSWFPRFAQLSNFRPAAESFGADFSDSRNVLVRRFGREQDAGV
ncbi:MAG: hypothetical protein ACJ74Q_03125 [Pyrinomonadaceae bacterium]